MRLRMSSRISWHPTFSALFFFPIYWLLMASFVGLKDMVAHGFPLVPLSFTLESYRLFFKHPDVWNWLWNSIVVALVSTGSPSSCQFQLPMPGQASLSWTGTDGPPHSVYLHRPVSIAPGPRVLGDGQAETD